MKIHSGPEHMRIHDKYFFARWTSDFYGLTHDLPHSILDFISIASPGFRLNGI